MQIFKTFFKIVTHYIPSVCIYFVVFLILCLIMTANRNNETDTSFSAKKADLAIIDRDKTTLSKELSSYLSSLQNVKEIKDEVETIQNELFRRNVDYILIIPKGYEEHIKNGEFDHIIENVKVPDSFSATYIDSQIKQYFKTIKTYMAAGTAYTDAITKTKSVLSISTDITLVKKPQSSSSTNLPYYFQYMSYVMICVIICSLGPILVRFNDRDLSARLNASALSLKEKNIFLILSSCLFSFLCWLLFIICAAIIYSHAFFGTLGLLCTINSFLFLAISVAITFLSSVLVSKADVFNMIGNTVGLGMSFLCGVFVPASVMNKDVLNTARVLPAYWYMDALNRFTDYTSSSQGLSTIIRDFGIEALFAVSLFIIALVISKQKRTNS